MKQFEIEDVEEGRYVSKEEYLQLEEKYRELENRYIELYNQYCRKPLKKRSTPLTDAERREMGSAQLSDF